MDRINGADTTDIGSGRRGFRAENLVAGVAGTEVTAEWLNGIQEEILRVVTEAGLVPNAADWSQLWQALKAFGLSSGSRSRRWMAVISMTLSSAPGSPAEGDAYLIPAGATGIWAGKVGQIAEWTGSAWTYFTPTDGHGIALPDGRIFERIGGVYTEFLASRSWVGSRTAATTKLNRLPWLPIISMTTTAPPASPAQGDTYLVPTGATGVWAANTGQIAEYLDAAWSYATPADGHGISLPDGRIFERISGVYVEKIAVDAQSGKWNYAVAGGTANALTAALTPPLTANSAGTEVNLLITTGNTSAATLNAGPAALPIVTQRGTAIKRGDLLAGTVARLICNGTSWMLAGGPAYSEVQTPLNAGITVYVRTDGDDNNDGLSNTAASAFRTLAGAYNVIRQKYFANGMTVTMQLGIPGNYEGFSHSAWPGTVKVVGGTPRSSYNITTIANTESVLVASNGQTLIVQDVSLLATPGASARALWAQGGTIAASGIQLRSTAAGALTGVLIENGGTVFLDGSIEVFYLSDCFAQCIGGARLYLGAASACTITLQAALTFSTAFVVATEGAQILRRNASFAGAAATGTRYLCSLNAIINTLGGGSSFFPGNAVVAPSTGGQYA